MYNYFNNIINQIKNNLIEDNNNHNIEIKSNKYPTGILQYFCKRQGAFKIDVDNVKITHTNDKYGNNIYLISYKDLNLDAPCLKHLKQYDKSIDRIKLNDELRYEDMRAYSTDSLTEYDGAYCKDTSVYYDDADTMFDYYLYTKGYTYKQYEYALEKHWLDKETVMCEYRLFLEQTKAQDYEIGEDVEDELIAC